MIITPNVKKIYASLQKQLFYLVPEKWDKIYLYASVTQQILNLETGELFFYYFPKGILKKNPVNVYEIPSKFSLNEEEYIKLVENLYETIKELWKIYKFSNQRTWSSITIKFEGLKFEIEFNYEDLSVSKYSSVERHILWKYKYLDLPLESFNRKDKKLIKEYLNSNMLDFEEDIETYTENIYKRPIRNVVDYNKETYQKQEKQVDEVIVDAEELERKGKKYTYSKKENQKETKKQNKKSSTKKEKRTKKKAEEKEPTYIEQIEAQRKAVKSQILNH